MQDEANQNKEDGYLTESFMKQFSSADITQLTLLYSALTSALHPPVKGVRNERLEGLDNNIIADILPTPMDRILFAKNAYETPGQLKPEFIERMQDVRNILNTAIGLYDHADPNDWHMSDAAKASDVTIDAFKKALKYTNNAISEYADTGHKTAIEHILGQLGQAPQKAEQRQVIGKHTEAMQTSGTWER